MDILLTTVDNPYNPHPKNNNPCCNPEQWLRWDIDHGYNTNGYLARIISEKHGYYNPDISPAEKEAIFDEAISEILENDVTGIFARVIPTDKTPLVEEAYSKTAEWPSMLNAQQ